MALSDVEVEAIHFKEFGYVATGLGQFARAVEAEVRKQDDALIRQLVEALDDLAGAGEDAWGEERPCVRIGKEAVTAGCAWLESKP